MSFVERAISEVRRAEAALRNLAAEAAKSGAYDEVVSVARMAAEIGRIAQVRASTQVAPAATLPATASKPRRHMPHPARPAKGYPQFRVRDGDLVKIGLSRVEGAEYEHRAPFGAVREILHSLARHGADRELVPTTDLLPIIDRRNGNEIPLYQVYVTLAWLREAGLIEQVGRQGYRLVDRDRFEELARVHWEQLAARSSE